MFDGCSSQGGARLFRYFHRLLVVVVILSSASVGTWQTVWTDFEYCNCGQTRSRTRHGVWPEGVLPQASPATSVWLRGIVATAASSPSALVLTVSKRPCECFGLMSPREQDVRPVAPVLPVRPRGPHPSSRTRSTLSLGRRRYSLRRARGRSWDCVSVCETFRLTGRARPTQAIVPLLTRVQELGCYARSGPTRCGGVWYEFSAIPGPPGRERQTPPPALPCSPRARAEVRLLA